MEEYHNGRTVYWGHWGISFLERQRDLTKNFGISRWKISFPVGNRGPIDSRPGDHFIYESIIKAWIEGEPWSDFPRTIPLPPGATLVPKILESKPLSELHDDFMEMLDYLKRDFSGPYTGGEVKEWELIHKIDQDWPNPWDEQEKEETCVCVGGYQDPCTPPCSEQEIAEMKEALKNGRLSR